jgi:hypothetical protein
MTSHGHTMHGHACRHASGHHQDTLPFTSLCPDWHFYCTLQASICTSCARALQQANKPTGKNTEFLWPRGAALMWTNAAISQHLAWEAFSPSEARGLAEKLDSVKGGDADK